MAQGKKEWVSSISFRHESTEKDAEDALGKLKDYARKQGFKVEGGATQEVAAPVTQFAHPADPVEGADGAAPSPAP